MARPPLFNGIPLTPPKRAALAALADFPKGSLALTTGPMNGGALSTLSMMGLVEREHTPQGFRYTVSDAGRRVLG